MILERILVPLDSSKRAEHVMPYVTLLAKQLRRPVILLSVVADGKELNPVASAHDAEIASFLDKRKSYAERYLAGAQKQLEEQGVTVSTEVTTGKVAESILAAAASHQVGLIAMATHGRVGPERWFLGSVADKVVRNASVPVLLLRPRNEGMQTAASIQHILLPLDGSTLAETAIPVATFFAKAFAVQVTLIRTLDLTQFAITADPYIGYDGAFSQGLLDSLQEDAKNYLEQTAEQLRKDGVEARTQFSFLPPATEITDTAEQEAGTMVVMASHGHSGLGRTVLGSVADRVVRSSVAPVLLVRSE